MEKTYDVIVDFMVYSIDQFEKDCLFSSIRQSSIFSLVRQDVMPILILR